MVFPKATISEIIGIPEAFNDAGGIEDAARHATDFDLDPAISPEKDFYIRYRELFQDNNKLGKTCRIASL